MSNLAIIDNEQLIDNTGGFNRVFGGTGSPSNPYLQYTDGYYQWQASFNHDYNAPGSTDTPMIFINDPKLLKKYRQVQISYYMTQYSKRAYNPQGISASFYNANGVKIGEIFNAFVTRAGWYTEEDVVVVDVPKNAVSVKFEVGANNDQVGSNTTCRIKQLILLHKKGLMYGSKSVTVYQNGKEVDFQYKKN